MRKLCGVGVNDASYKLRSYEYQIQSSGDTKRVQTWICPYYSRWRDMINRCYNKNRVCSSPTYKDCTVCEEWLTFSNFRKWMSSQDWEGKHLDKDLLVADNKEYSPTTCVFVTQKINSFLVDSLAIRGDLMIGVSLYSGKALKYVARCNNPFSKKTGRGYLGVYDTEIEAHLAWKSQKNSYARLLSEEVDNPLIKEALIRRWE